MKHFKYERRRMAAILFALLPAAVHAQGMREDYRRAEQFLAPNIRRLVFEGQVAANWIEKSSRFWYRNDKPAGKEFILVDAAQNTRQPAFDHEKLAASLSRAAAKSYRANTLPFDSITFVEDGRAIQFDIERTRWICNLTTYECAPGKEEEPRRAPRQGPGQATRPPRLDVPSPDGKLTAFVRSHNIYVRVVATGGEVPLSRDGEKFYDYATPLPSPALIANPYSGRSGIH